VCTIVCFIVYVFYLSIKMFHKLKSEQVKQVISQGGRLLLSNADLEFAK
jgi:hypothetical protein